MLSGQAFRAGRLVVDTGLHVMGWTREQAITYMLEHSVESRAYIETEIDRYLAVPGQATAYMIGSLEIQKLRRDAERQLGTRFDIKSFHDAVLRDGAVTLPMLQKAVARWVQGAERVIGQALPRRFERANKPRGPMDPQDGQAESQEGRQQCHHRPPPTIKRPWAYLFDGLRKLDTA